MEAALLAKAAAPVFSGFSAFSAAQGEKKRAQINSYIGRTRAIQTDVTAREGLESELGSIRAALGANGQAAGVGTLEFMQEIRDNGDRERRINVGNRMREAADANLQGQAAGQQASGALIGGALRSGPGLFDLYQYYR